MILAAAAVAASVAMARVSVAPSLVSDAGWSSAAQTALTWDYSTARPAPQATTVRLLFDDRYLYVRFDAQQREPIIATQTIDDVGRGSDDMVRTILWPAGPGGFQYVFEATPRGTHYQSSTENTVYAPTWTSVGTVRDGGYRVTMRIPLNALRGDGRHVWNAQFTRRIRQAAETDEWSHAPGERSTDAIGNAGLLTGLDNAVASARTQPRAGIYMLAEAGTRATGGSTSRAGADVAIPLTQTASFVAAFHPDYSNVEIDQQTIAPTTFRRQFTEVRPFFAQGTKFYDYTTCLGCKPALELYTPAIPTPKQGYQLEGKQGVFTFGALDTVGDRRVDNAQSLAYSTPNNTFQADYTRVSSVQPVGVHDVVDYGYLSWNDQRRWSVYAEGGVEHGSAVTDAGQARRYNAGVAFDPKDTLVALAFERIGAQYSPADGFVAVNDIAGYVAQARHTWRFANGPVQAATGGLFLDRFAGSDGSGTNLTDVATSGSVFFRNRISLLASFGSSFYRVPGDPVLHPKSQQVLRVDYRLASALQSTIAFNEGHFGDGYLTTAQLQTGFRVARKATISLYAVDTDWRGHSASRAVQWLERGSITFDLGPRSSLVAGVRKIIGVAPPFPGLATPAFVNATNLSFGYAARRTHDDLYLVYGDASALQTRPALSLKIVHYLGAEKGT